MTLKKGKILTVLYRAISSFFHAPKDGSKKPTGVEGNLLVTLMDALDTDYNLVVQADYDVGSKIENGSWTGMIGRILRGEADMAMASTVHTYDRSKVVDFTVPYLFSSVNFATELPTPLPRAYALVYPFDEATWALLLGSILVLPAVFAALFHRDFSKEWLNMLGNLLGRSVIQTIAKPRQALFLVTWWFGTLVIASCYSSLFFSCLSVPPRNVPPKDFYQLARAVQKGEYKVFSPRVSILREMLDSSPNDQIRSIMAAIEKNDWYFDAKDYAKVAKGNREALISPATHFKLNYGEGQFITRYQSEGLMEYYCSIIVSKRLPELKSRLDGLLLKIQQAGLFEKYVQDGYFKNWHHSTASSSESAELIRPLTFEDLLGAFVILVGGWCLSGIVLISEWSYKKTSGIFSINLQACKIIRHRWT